VVLSVILPCCNRADSVGTVLRALDQQTLDQPFEVVAIDDASTDGSLEILRGFHPESYSLKLLEQKERQGPAVARNRGIKASAGDLLLFIGDDIAPAPSMLEEHLRMHGRHPQPEVSILGKVIWPDDLTRNTLMNHICGLGSQQFSYMGLQDGQECGPRHFYTANISTKSSLLKTSGELFDETFPHPAFEDFEVAYRLHKRGMKVLYHASALGRHYHYHNIYSFAQRQLKVGQMRVHLVNLHPELAKFHALFDLKWLQYYPLAARLQMRIRPGQDMHPTADWLEATVLHMASSYEWRPHVLLDDFFGRVLRYFLDKGSLEALYSEGSGLRNEVLDTHTIYSLTRTLRRFFHLAKGSDLGPSPVSPGSVEERIDGVWAPLPWFVSRALESWNTHWPRFPEGLP
jgi:glycosyltransferase involved in cell wall biosynthesis